VGAAAAANAFFARARAVVVVVGARRIRFKSPLCVRAIGSLAFRGICVKAREGSQEEKKEREKETDRPWGVASVG